MYDDSVFGAFEGLCIARGRKKPREVVNSAPTRFLTACSSGPSLRLLGCSGAVRRPCLPLFLFSHDTEKYLAFVF